MHHTNASFAAPGAPTMRRRRRRPRRSRLTRVATLRRFAVLAALGSILLSACSPSSAASPGGLTGGTGSAAASAPGGPAGSGAGASVAPVAAPSGSIFPNGLMIVDRGNGRLIVVNDAKQIVWQFPVAGSMPSGLEFSADDAFFAPDGKTIVASDEGRHIIYRIDIATREVIWSYGHYDRAGSVDGYLNTPDDAYPLPNGDIVVADINNCRILQIAPDKSIVHQWGTTGVCTDHAPRSYGAPNGDTPLPDGGLLITVIRGSRLVRLSATGAVIFDIHLPIVYPSDAQLLPSGDIIVAGYTNPGVVIEITPAGKLMWRYAPTSGPGRLNHPSLATPLANGLVSINDDDRQRMIVIDPTTMKIVWQYGKTDVAGTGPGLLSDPDGHQPVPANVTF
jgi:outer membrane protein assembly factor BamB